MIRANRFARIALRIARATKNRTILTNWLSWPSWLSIPSAVAEALLVLGAALSGCGYLEWPSQSVPPHDQECNPDALRLASQAPWEHNLLEHWSSTETLGDLKITSTSTERQKRSQNLAPVLVIFSAKSLVFSRKIITSTDFYRYCAPDASAPVVVINQSPTQILNERDLINHMRALSWWRSNKTVFM